MKNENARIFIIEDDALIAQDLTSKLSKAGYEVLGNAPSGEEGLEQIEALKPDLVLMDIHLAGQIDGIATAQALLQKATLPIIYLTDMQDDATFERARETHPAAFLNKPFSPRELMRAIDLAFDNANQFEDQQKPPEAGLLNDSLFLKDKEAYKRVLLSEVLFVQAERSYCQIITQEKQYVLSMPMSTLSEKLPADVFVKVHRSYIVNLKKVSGLYGNNLLINEHEVPLGKSYRQDILKQLTIL